MTVKLRPTHHHHIITHANKKLYLIFLLIDLKFCQNEHGIKCYTYEDSDWSGVHDIATKCTVPPLVALPNYSQRDKMWLLLDSYFNFSTKEKKVSSESMA